MVAFGTDDQEAICVRILSEGELQVGRGLTSGLHEETDMVSSAATRSHGLRNVVMFA